MIRRIALTLALATSLVAGAVPAHAEPLVLDTDRGYGHAEVYAWSRGYHRVMIYGEYHGFADVRFRVHCTNGYTRTHSWTDGGPHFRFVTSVPAYARCNYAASIRTGGAAQVFLGIGAFS
jgi:hypothetical protein